ncbi:MAG: RnfABCDGE type electron transport complex subunit D [Oscillibacter sp.]|nr:RnfABCDGE type electron transport complex subunit D [Oscillibacter sp.]
MTTLTKPTAQSAQAEKNRVLPGLSSSPHVRSRLTTGQVMYDVILALCPAAVVGVYHHGFHAFMVIAVSILTAVMTEFIFDFVAGRPNTLRDGSAVVTGLLLALCLPASVPLYIPYAGSLFAILVVKCLFGGLGKNFMNPALTGRCFLLISFGSVMTNFAVDGVSAATPLADLAAGKLVDVSSTFLGFQNGVIGGSIAALMLGGLYLWVVGGITFEIPAAALVSFSLFIALFGGQGFDPVFILAHLCGGGIVMGAVFMATDPVTSPVTSTGQLIFGALVGVLSGVFRVLGSAADSVSYAIIISNMATPLIDEFCVPKPYGHRPQSMEPAEEKRPLLPKPALALCVITLVAGVCLSGVYKLTKDTIAEQQMAANLASYQEVCPGAVSFAYDDGVNAAIEALGGDTYGADFGRVTINEAVIGADAAGNAAGCVVSVTSADGYDGNVTLSVGIAADGTVNGIAFTELNETPSMGMLCGEPAFKDQFSGVLTDSFILNKAGGSTADNEIDSVTGASTTSGAVVNAVNAALDFWRTQIKEVG